MCRSGCPTQDCGSYAACLKGMNLRVAYCGIGGGDATEQKKWDANLNEYRSLVSQGIQPEGSSPRAVQKAKVISEKTGKAFQA